jgi:hypothetical protein
MPQSTISRIEGLTHGLPRLTTLKKIAKALDAELIITLKVSPISPCSIPPTKKSALEPIFLCIEFIGAGGRTSRALLHEGAGPLVGSPKPLQNGPLRPHFLLANDIL